MIKELIKEAIVETLRESDPKESDPVVSSHHPLIGKDVVIRARNAGVHYGKLVETGDFVTLENAHRIWKWSGAFTLSELSQKGITGGRVACEVSHLSIPVSDIGEILNLTPEAREKLSGHIES